MDFLDSLNQIKSDIEENAKKKELEAEKAAIAEKEQALMNEFLEYMKDLK